MIHFASLVTHSSPLSSISFWYRKSYIANSLVTPKKWRVGDEWINLLYTTFSTRYKDLGDEWVTSVLKWITAVIVRLTMTCSVEGDELTSYVKILFFKALLFTCACLTFNSKKCKAHFVMSGLQVHFFAKVFVEGGTLLPLFVYNTLIIKRK